MIRNILRNSSGNLDFIEFSSLFGAESSFFKTYWSELEVRLALQRWALLTIHCSGCYDTTDIHFAKRCGRTVKLKVVRRQQQTRIADFQN